MTETVKVLSDDEVGKLLALSQQNTGPSFGYTHELCKAVDALCATVCALRADYALIENYLAEIKRELGLPPNTVLGVTLENYKERVTAPLREQLARLQSDYAALQQINDAAERERQAAESQLAQVTQENERLLRGEFTPEEFQNLCHDTDIQKGFDTFADGCEAYQQKMFGRCRKGVI